MLVEQLKRWFCSKILEFQTSMLAFNGKKAASIFLGVRQPT